MIIAHPAPLARVHRQHHIQTQKPLSVIAYVGGRHPHVTVTVTYGSYEVTSYRLHTPRGWVSVRWQEDEGTEDGGPVPPGPEPDISHPDTIKNIVITSPEALPVYFQGADDAKWVHLNGSRVSSVPAHVKNKYGSYYYVHFPYFLRMKGGRNEIAVGYPDAE